MLNIKLKSDHETIFSSNTLVVICKCRGMPQQKQTYVGRGFASRSEQAPLRKIHMDNNKSCGFKGVEFSSIWIVFYIT